MENLGKREVGKKVSLDSALREVKKLMRGGKGKRVGKSCEEKEEVREVCEIKPEIFKGSGKVLVSGTTVHGIGTLFTKELKQGDYLIFNADKSEEKRKVVLVLSDKSALISESFDTEKNSEFFIESWPEAPELKKVDEEEELKKKRKIVMGEEVYEVRVKRGPWTYKVDTVRSKDGMSREELLNVRAQRVRDKFCWM